ncbi:heme exporter protein A [Hasllibacter halocynthiae]|uniref:Heme exporter protein A n=1 Tax=Hasllibacter halocynthiae TaxID=595589 RepID=A0A2T0X911_9RHOB|nr:heme ABC exporter ATP-binding protein CcmA [Hasllibacter halocynthiae]PRY95407.1 heme exporter protein A [Hasllibacter halocynthiae]
MLTVTDLALRRGLFARMLEGVSFRVGRGEALVLRGRNGIGKTTLLRAVAGLGRIEAGRIEVDPDAVAFAGHLDGLKPSLTVAENLSFWARVHGRPGGRQDLVGALAALDLAGLEDRAAADLSAGQRRRAGLARLPLLARPFWILDEPTVTLDAVSVALFEGLLAGHLSGGGAALLSSHLPVAGARELDLGPFVPAPVPTGAEERW